MRRPIIAYMDNGPPVQMLSRRDFPFSDDDEKYVPAVLAYIHDTDVETLNTLLRTRTPEEVVATFPNLSDLEKKIRSSYQTRPEFLTSGSRGWAEYYRDTRSLFLRIQNVRKDELDLSDVAYVQPPDTAEARRTRVQRRASQHHR